MTNTQSSAPVPLPEDFEARQQAWYKSVAGVFARTQKKDVADIPLDVWKKLIRTNYDGIDVNPLYTRADEAGENVVPGAFPFVRGTTAERYGWGVTETFGGSSAEQANKDILHALNNGTTDLVLDFTEGLTAADLPAVLRDVLLDLAPVHLRAGSKLPEVAAALYQRIDAAGVTPTVTLGATPLTSSVDGSETVSLAQAVELAVAAPAGVRAITVDAVSFSNQGATDAQEIGFALAAGVEYLRALTDAGMSVADALGQVAFRFATNDDQFSQIAKFRAARELWARVAEVLGAPDAGAAPQYAVTAPVMFSQRDPWVNMLRVTVAAFAAGVGGATAVEVLPFDYAVPGGLPNTSRAFAHRIARNTNLLLLEESHLGHVIDPAGGSYFVEDFTDKLADKAWAVFTEVEAKGGLTAAADFVRETLDAAHEATRVDIAHRRKQLTGINEFPNLLERPLSAELRVEPAGVRRWAAEFEALRDRSDAFLEAQGARPQAVLIPLGPLAKHNIRTGFATNLLASGGIEALNPGQVVPGTEEFTAAAKSAPIAVICGTDPEYGESGADALAALRDAGVGTVLVAGASSALEGADGYLNMKIDAAKTLSELLTTLGA
ncbi:methylmalonyl-CoA mutase family protein [Corynebacterium sp.]|uniref:methylmalonyl-CoA mutase family protein n=1 Tax=Corynebacterium sp. TaxID=1720 RepID=UPI0026DCB092|nr:methylmalonyl-CoA mutase family protein [Corynebacterium sp.]MDO5077433.1 methylmalonyl-CoA mutase family protein [Corynebacterium sp.]